ncbi:anti-sigma factor family protein [Nonomuraea sp. NPDC052265]|uniref:anti-sigma factor family protein n=1 Tax=Nonomuraea sp. NPDC052265 TaxID=3364374 RepID=UPI0037C8F312
MTTCEEVRIAMGAHALGALEPDEALEIDNHLATCETCGAELLELEGVAAFLGKVSERDVELVASPPRQVLDRLLNARARRYRRGRLMLAVAASVAVIAVGGTVWTVTRQDVPQQSAAAPAAAPQSSVAGKSPETEGFVASDAAPDAQLRKAVPSPSAMPTTAGRTGDGRAFKGENPAKDYYATVYALPGAGNTELLVTVRNVPVGTDCSLAVYDDRGRRELAGSWTVSRETYRKETVFQMETPVLMRDITHFEVVDGTGRVLVKVDGPARK